MKKFSKQLAVIVSLVICCSIMIPSITLQAAPIKRPGKIYMNQKKVQIYVGENYKLKIVKVLPAKASKQVKWESKNEKIATVSQSGNVRGISQGTTTITAISKVDHKVKVSCKITVKKFKNKLLGYTSHIILNDDMQNLDCSTNKDQNLLISTYGELKKLRSYIKKNYDYPNKVLKQLKKYDKHFFETKCLYYTNDLVVIPSDFKMKQVKKEMVNGKIICSIVITETYTPPGGDRPVTGDRGKSVNNEYIIELRKKDVKDVAKFKLVHNRVIKR